MVYEYEDEIKEYLRYATRPDTEKYLEMHLELTKVYKKAYLLREMTKTMLIPIEEIYAKAKAFDQVIKKVETEFVSGDLADSIRILVNDYEYDMEDK